MGEFCSPDGTNTMTQAKTALLPDRGVVCVDGAGAEKLLQGLITNDVELASSGTIYAALLTPQGKILFDFFVARFGSGYLLETAAGKTAELAKRLEMYRLRSPVEIADVSHKFRAVAVWGALRQTPDYVKGTAPLVDPRLSELGLSMLVVPSYAAELTAAVTDHETATADYQAHRISLGVPEGGKDYVFGDAFPHEANLDLLNGVSFSKGCFVGQEVVSRMQHRGTARKRIVIVEGDKPLETGSEIVAGQATLGTIGSVAGNRALALVRLDRVEEMQRKGEQITAAGAALAIRLPDYMKPAVPAGAP